MSLSHNRRAVDGDTDPAAAPDDAMPPPQHPGANDTYWQRVAQAYATAIKCIPFEFTCKRRRHDDADAPSLECELAGSRSSVDASRIGGIPAPPAPNRTPKEDSLSKAA